MALVKKSLKISLTFGLVLLAGIRLPAAYSAEACTYNEALLALQQGNMIRGQALMKMAANDGDQRAVSFLASFEAITEKQLAEKLSGVSTARAGR